MMAFKYLYRDAGNFKAFGQVVLKGMLLPGELSILRASLPGDGFFIAEQLGVPPLYEALFRWSSGPTEADHCWHEFVEISEINERSLPVKSFVWGEAKTFLSRLCSISAWNEELSPHFA